MHRHSLWIGIECEPNVYVSNMILIGFPDSPGDIYNVPRYDEIGTRT